MNKLIRILIENLFNDEIFNKDEYDSDVEVALSQLTHIIGDIYYKDREPLAVCCGLEKDFKDNKSRFVILNQEYYTNISNINVIIPELYLDNFNEQDLSLNHHIDENGYYNTQSVLNSDWYKPGVFPAFLICKSLGDNYYLPAIDELKIMCLNILKINDSMNLLSENKTFLKHAYYWSSTQCSRYKFGLLDARDNLIFPESRILDNLVRPFIKLDD